MSGRSLATIRVVKDGQEYVINQTDYRWPDNTVRPQWKGAKVLGQQDLTSDQIEVNSKIDAKEQAEKDATAKAKEQAAKALVDDLPTGQDLADYIEDLPNKGAVLKFAQDQGVELDSSLSRPDLNQAAFSALTEGEEVSDQEGGV